MKTLKLYRGLSADEFKAVSTEAISANRQCWLALVTRRANGNFGYPADLDKTITRLHRDLRLERQYFTDSKEIAKGYARKVGGILVEVTVPVKDVVRHFDVEFQNFGRRKKRFEIVYCVKGALLAKRSKTWRLKVSRA